jgi:hypothetical protein
VADCAGKPCGHSPKSDAALDVFKNLLLFNWFRLSQVSVKHENLLHSRILPDKGRGIYRGGTNRPIPGTKIAV